MKETNYPFIFIHGYFGFGDDELISKFMPYFGIYKASVEKIGRSMGYEVYTPTVESFGSCWDRACELYAQIKGGTVDYGKVHSEKAGHERYGKTYEGCIPNWGELDANGKTAKINLVGHSFGAPTGRMLIELLVNGNEEERKATPVNELSSLFKGGHNNWVHSFQTLAGTHEGTTMAQFAKKAHLINFASKLTFGICGMLNDTKADKLYAFGCNQYKLKNTDGKLDKEVLNEMSCRSFDNIYYEMTVEDSHTLMSTCKEQPNIYYFTYTGRRTKELTNLPGRINVPKFGMFPLFFVATAPIMGVFTDKKVTPSVDSAWHESDGVVNVMSARGPIDGKCEEFKSIDQCKPGIWYQYPIIEGYDHLSFMGFGENKNSLTEFYKGLFTSIDSLPETV